jgi:hypothetical protein
MMTLLTVFRAETELYKALEPGIRLVILKAICDIRGEVCALLFCEIFPIINVTIELKCNVFRFCGIRPTALHLVHLFYGC